MTEANSLNISTVGILGNTGTAITATAVTQYDVIVGGSTSSTLSSVGPGSSGQVLQSGGNAANPAYSTATYPATATGTGTLLRADGTNWSATTSTYPNTNAVSTLLYASSANVMSALTTVNNGVLITSASGVPSWLAAGTTGQILTATTGSPASWASPAPAAITITGDSGGGLNSSSFTFTGGTTGLTFSGSGTTETLTGTLVVANGGTGKNSFTAYMPIVGGTTTTGALQSVAVTNDTTPNFLMGNGSSAVPTWTTIPLYTDTTNYSYSGGF
jgi:hypothetical protein